jgi:predicted SAM-dependent methyltransferase
MNIIDKNNIIDNISNGQYNAIELGCGNQKRITNSIGIDRIDYDCVDIVGDVFEILEMLPGESIDAVYSFHFFEHIDDLQLLLTRIARVLKLEGVLEIVVPHFANPYFYSDYTHRSFYGLYTLSYFCSNQYFKRKVPNYNSKMQYRLLNVDLIFKSSLPFYFRYAIKSIVGKLINLNNYMKEFYEENLCYLIPCYEIKYQLIKASDNECNTNKAE